MFRVALFVAVALVGVVAVVAVVGRCLPKGHRASRSLTLSASPHEVFQVITDVARGAEWRSDLERVEQVSGNGVGMTFREVGKNGAVPYRVEGIEPDRRFVTAIADSTLPYGGRWTFDLAPRGEGTDLTITEDGEVFNPIFRFMSRFVFSPTATIERYQSDLSKRLGQ